MKTRSRSLAVMKCGTWALLALLALSLVHHGHGDAGSIQDDCVRCHVHHAPVIVAETTDALPACVASERIETASGDGERDRALSGHPTRGPPA